MNYLSLSLFLGLIASNSYAQTPSSNPSMSAQITMTRDYTQSILTKIQNAPADRFNESQDYAIEGVKLKKRMEDALIEFRASMDLLMAGGLADAIASYDSIVTDKVLPVADRNIALELQRTVLTQQRNNASVIYQNEIRKLYRLIPEIVFKQFIARNKQLYFSFEDGSEFFWLKGDRQYCAYQAKLWNTYFTNAAFFKHAYLDQSPEVLQGEYTAKFSKYLKSICSTQVCAGGILQQLSSYFLFVKTYLDQNLVIRLADGSTIHIETFKESAGYAPVSTMIEIVSTFVFDPSFSNLPFKN